MMILPYAGKPLGCTIWGGSSVHTSGGPFPFEIKQDLRQ